MWSLKPHVSMAQGEDPNYRLTWAIVVDLESM